MIRPFGFFWSKILPISYDNYLSETEILEMLRQKTDELILKVNDLGTQFENIGDIVNNYYISNVLPELEKTLDSIREYIVELESTTEEKIENLKIYVDTMDNHILIKLSDLEVKHDADIDRLQAEIDLLDNRADFLRSYVDKQLGLKMLEVSRMMRALYRNVVTYVRTYFEELANTNIIVASPLTGKKVTLQYALEELLQWQAHGLTAYQYRMLDISATDYLNLGLTAEEYRLYGISGDYIQPKNEHFDLSGVRTEEPLSSVYEIFGDGITANMGNLDITCEQYRALSEEHSALELDKYGAYILTNQYKSVNKDTISIVSPEHILGNGVHEINVPLSPILDSETNPTVPYVSLFNAMSADVAELIPVFGVDISQLNAPTGSFSAQLGNVTFNAVNKTLFAQVFVFNDLKDGSTPVNVHVQLKGHTTTKTI